MNFALILGLLMSIGTAMAQNQQHPAGSLGQKMETDKTDCEPCRIARMNRDIARKNLNTTRTPNNKRTRAAKQ